MRQIFSVILAAALVFGGTLFMAGYFAGIEVTVPPPPPKPTAGPASHEPAVDRGSLWHCPDIERVLAAPLPEVFSPLSRDNTKIDARFKWHDAEIGQLWGEAEGTVSGDTLTCNYRLERSLSAPEERSSWSLFLSPQFAAEVNIGKFGDGPWKFHMVFDGGGIAGCDISPAACGFYLVPPNGSVRSSGWPLHPPEMPGRQK